MSVADLRLAIEATPLLDHHTHVLAAPGSQYRLLELLSESDYPDQVAEVRNHPVFHLAKRDLGALLGVEPEEAALDQARTQADYGGFVRRLMQAANIEEMLVDDGYRFPGALSVTAHARMVGCPVRRILRLEQVTEEAARGWDPFHQVVERARAGVDEALEAGAAGLKTIAAYRCGLDLPQTDRADAARGYDRWRSSGSNRLTDPAVISYVLHQALEVVLDRGRSVPLQVHVGVGDSAIFLPTADPGLLRPLLADPRYRAIPIVLLHCYPFVRHASYLASTYPQAYLDLSLTLLLAPHRGTQAVLEALELAPASKLLLATDASRLPEMFFLGAAWSRRALANALVRLTEDNAIDEASAVRWGRLALRDNARRLYWDG